MRGPRSIEDSLFSLKRWETKANNLRTSGPAWLNILGQQVPLFAAVECLQYGTDGAATAAAACCPKCRAASVRASAGNRISKQHPRSSTADQRAVRQEDQSRVCECRSTGRSRPLQCLRSRRCRDRLSHHGNVSSFRLDRRPPYVTVGVGSDRFDRRNANTTTGCELSELRHDVRSNVSDYACFTR